MIKKYATAQWTGNLKEGSGRLSTQSGAMNGVAYSHATRFEDKSGANPEELIGAAHASCYAMFLSGLIGGAHITGSSVDATSTISLDPTTEGGPTVMGAHLTVKVKGDAPEATLRDLAEKAKVACPISKLLKAAVTLEVTVG